MSKDFLNPWETFQFLGYHCLIIPSAQCRVLSQVLSQDGACSGTSVGFCLHACFLSALALSQFNLRFFVKVSAFRRLQGGFFNVEKVKHLSSWLKGT